MVDCSIEELLCLHLRIAAGGDGDEPPPYETSTPGVLDALDVSEGAITSHFTVVSGLARLSDRGLIEERTVAVAGTGETRVVYQLTEAGRELAGEVERRLADQQVTVQTAEGTRTLSLPDAAERLDGSLAYAVARLQDDVIVLDDAESVPDADDLPPVDREDALARLDARYDDPASDSAPLLLTGEPGVGKTHVVTALRERVRDRGGGRTFLLGRCTPETETPYEPFLDALEDLPPDDRERVTAVLAPDDAPDPGDPDELRRRREAVFADVAAALRSLAGDEPLVVGLDDVQWLGRPTALLVAHLSSELAAEPVLIVATASPKVPDPEAPLREALAEYDLDLDRVDLGPFAREHTADLVSRVVGTRRVPRSFVDRVHDHTGGNPLFVVEGVTRLLEAGLVRPDAGVYPPPTEELPVPDTVEAAISVRLDQLDDRTTELVETASLVGAVVPVPVLVAASDLSAATVRDRVAALVESRLWTPEGDDGDETESRIGFASDVVRETVRDSIPEDRRPTLHGRVARAYQESAPGETTASTATAAAAAAYHYDRAGEPEAAIEASLTAARAATAVYAHEVAVEACERAVDLAREMGDDDAVLEGLELLGNTYETIGEFDEARRCFGYVRERAEDPETIGLMWNREAQISTKTSEFETARECLERSLDIHRDLDAPEVMADTLNNLGAVAVKQSDFEAARGYFERTGELYREMDDELGEAKALSNVGVIERKQGNFEAAREAHRRSLEIFRRLGDTNEEANALGNLGIVAQKRGDLSAARDWYQQCIEHKREVDDPRGEARVYENLGGVEWMDGNLDAAREHLRRAIDIGSEVGDRHLRAQARHRLGTVSRDDGEYEAAREYYRRALEAYRDLGDRSREAGALGDFGVLAWLDGTPDTAIERLGRCLDIYRETGEAVKRARYLGIAGAVEISRGKIADGRAKRQEALSTLADADNPLAEVTVLRYHVEVELDRDNRDNVRELCERARVRIDGIDADLGAERERIESLCDGVE
jgi:tetratricopeptide (TPR) repeat protein/DNA-binding PadR family transcriptional regulator